MEISTLRSAVSRFSYRLSGSQGVMYEVSNI
jgi:hypothetical protein